MMRYSYYRSILWLALICLLPLGRAYADNPWWFEARAGMEPFRPSEFGESQWWLHYSRGTIFGMAAGWEARQDISVCLTLMARVRQCQDWVDSNSWFWNVMVYDGKPAILKEAMLGSRLHLRTIGQGAYMQYSIGLQEETFGEIVGDSYNWGRTIYLGQEKMPERTRYRPIGCVGLGYDQGVKGRFYLGLEGSVLLTFDEVNAIYSIAAKVGFLGKER